MSRFLEDLTLFLKEKDEHLIRVSEYKNGVIETVEFEETDYCRNVYSVAKTFAMTAIGILYDKGLIKVEDKVCDILSDELPERGMDERWRNATVENALTHKLGLPGGFLDIDCNKSSVFTENYLDYMFRYPLKCDPGTEYCYSDGAFYLISCIVEKITGICLDTFLWKELFLKLDFQEVAWSHCPKGHAMGATGLYIHSSDMVKLGALYLNNGVYNGDRILSEEWCRLAVEKHYALDWDDESHTVYQKGGMHGQSLMVIPGSKRAVAVQSFNGDTGSVRNFARNYKDQQQKGV
ncbi:MAG: beta-lactamase family protein [Clostridia bacterium]|nr:beta-lactamase family protein [Clostridia bacterium]